MKIHPCNSWLMCNRYYEFHVKTNHHCLSSLFGVGGKRNSASMFGWLSIPLIVGAIWCQILKVFSIVVICMGVYYPLKDKLVCY